MPSFLRHAVFFAAAMVAYAAPARAQVEALRQIPDGVGEPLRDRLNRERAELRTAYQHLSEEGRLFNRRCASVDKGSAAAADCARSHAVLNERRLDYNTKARAFNGKIARALGGRAKALEAEIARLRGRIAGHQQALRNIGFETTARQFEDYAARAKEGQMEAIRVASKSAVELTFGLVGNVALTHRPVNPAQSASLGHRLKAAGVTDPFVLDRVYNLHKIKPAEIKDFLSRLKAASFTVIGHATSHGAADSAAQVTLAVLSHFVKDNALAHKLALGELITEGVVLAATYAEVRTGTSQMLKATEPQLQAMKPIQAMIKTDVEALTRAKRDLARLKRQG